MISQDLPINEATDALWHAGELSWKLDSLQRSIRTKFHEIQSDKVLILSARQIGKSYLSAIIGLELALKNPGSIVRILAPTLKQVSDIVADNLAPICFDAPQGLVRRSKSDSRWHIGNSTLRLGALERAHVDAARGGNADFVIYEEGGFVHSEDYKYAIESVCGPQLLRSGGRELHISSPSEDSEHYLHTDILPYCESKNAAFAYSIYDSPSITPRQIEKAIERCGGVHTDAFRREYLAEIVRSKTLMVIPEFDYNRHVMITPIPEHYCALFVLDMGGTRDKTAGLVCIWDFLRAKMLVTHEIFMDRNTQSSVIIEETRNVLKEVQVGKHVYGDVPGQTSIDMQKEFKFPIRPVIKTDLEANLNNFRLLFVRDQIEINPRCKWFIGSLKSCRYNDQRTDFLRTEMFGHADMVMAGAYGARLIDKITNPYPRPKINPDTQIQVPYRNKEFSGLEQLALELNPWHPMRVRK